MGDIQSFLRFLFSDVNLSNDTFLRNILSAGSVPIATLLRFRKFEALRTTEDDIRSAVQSAEDLSLSFEHGQGWSVQRRIPYVHVDGAFDHQTVYVEGVPPDANVEWVRARFERFGPIAHVSVPRLKQPAHERSSSGKPLPAKGMAFVTFQNPSDLHSAVAWYSMGSGTRGSSSHGLLLGPGATPVTDLKVVPKARWLELKQQRATSSSSTGGPSAISASSSGSDTGAGAGAHVAGAAGLPGSSESIVQGATLHGAANDQDALHVLVKLSGLLPDTPFAALRAACRAPGRVEYIECPAVHGNGRTDAAVQGGRRLRSRRTGARRGKAMEQGTAQALRSSSDGPPSTVSLPQVDAHGSMSFSSAQGRDMAAVEELFAPGSPSVDEGSDEGEDGGESGSEGGDEGQPGAESEAGGAGAAGAAGGTVGGSHPSQASQLLAAAVSGLSSSQATVSAIVRYKSPAEAQAAVRYFSGGWMGGAGNAGSTGTGAFPLYGGAITASLLEPDSSEARDYWARALAAKGHRAARPATEGGRPRHRRPKVDVGGHRHEDGYRERYRPLLSDRTYTWRPSNGSRANGQSNSADSGAGVSRKRRWSSRSSQPRGGHNDDDGSSVTSSSSASSSSASSTGSRDRHRDRAPRLLKDNGRGGAVSSRWHAGLSGSPRKDRRRSGGFTGGRAKRARHGSPDAPPGAAQTADAASGQAGRNQPRAEADRTAAVSHSSR